MVIGAGTVVSAAAGGPVPPFLDYDGAPVVEVDAHAHPDVVLHVAGSGSNLPLTRALARAFESRGRGRVIVHASIGSRGGIRATRDRAVELGLISRRLTPAERTLGVVEHPYARTPVSFAAHPSVPVDDLTTAEILALYRGERSTWPDGTRVVVLQREPGDSSHRAVEAVVPQFGPVNERAYEEARWSVLHHDAAMREALENTTGALGLFGQGAIPALAGFKPLRVNGVTPGTEPMDGSRYPFHKDLSLVSLGNPVGLRADFLAFVRSEEGRALIRDLGYMPLPAED